MIIGIVYYGAVISDNVSNLSGNNKEALNVSDIANGKLTRQEFEQAFREVAWTF